MKFSTLKLLSKLVADAIRIRDDEDWLEVYKELQGTISVVEKMKHSTVKIPIQLPLIQIIQIEKDE